MNIKNFQESLQYMAKASVTPFIWGHAGIGKSEVVRKYAESLGYKFFPFYLGTMSDVGDILGLAEFTKRADGKKSTDFAPPGWLVDMIEYCDENPDSGAVIFLDEFNRGRRDILNGCFSLALDKTFHTIKLPKNCHVVAAGNPPTEEYVTTDVNETALMARFVHIKLEPTVEEWVEYAKNTELNDNLVQFIRQQPELLEEKRSEFKLPVKVDRRAYSRLDRLYKVGTPDHLMQELMIGIIGLERTVAFQQFLKEQDKPLTGAEVLSGDKFNLIERWSDSKDVVSSLLNLTCDNVQKELVARDATKEYLTDPEKANLMRFFESVPLDISFKLQKTLIEVDKTTHKEIEILTKFYMDDRFDYKKRMIAIVKKARGKEDEKVEEKKKTK